MKTSLRYCYMNHWPGLIPQPRVQDWFNRTYYTYKSGGSTARPARQFIKSPKLIFQSNKAIISRFDAVI